MSSDIAISVENLSKCYRIHHEKRRPRTFAEAFRGAVSTPFKYLADRLRKPEEDELFWALKDVSFEVKRGEAVGIIGRNGAGKSTLLKILSRITDPTKGKARIHGRVNSLLEVGTGFHPELTGRENIYMNAAMHGMKRAEINAKFDEIVDFAEVEKFIDTPVKRYSSGMYTRLAFAVAANLEPEILVVDEVLAVGDIAFQQKCLGKMRDVASFGRTVLFVSHNMGAVATLTRQALFLSNGRVEALGETGKIISKYLAANRHGLQEWRALDQNDNPIQILSISIAGDDGRPMESFDVLKGFTISVGYIVRRAVRNAVIAANIHAVDGTHLLSLEDIDERPGHLLNREKGTYTASVTVPGKWLRGGGYRLRIGCGIVGQASYENIDDIAFSLVETGDSATRGHRGGHILPMLKWTTSKQ